MDGIHYYEKLCQFSINQASTHRIGCWLLQIFHLNFYRQWPKLFHIRIPKLFTECTYKSILWIRKTFIKNKWPKVFRWSLQWCKERPFEIYWSINSIGLFLLFNLHPIRYSHTNSDYDFIAEAKRCEANDNNISSILFWMMFSRTLGWARPARDLWNMKLQMRTKNLVSINNRLPYELCGIIAPAICTNYSAEQTTVCS